MKRLFAIEGIDGAGKTSIAKLIQKNLESKLYTTYEPTNISAASTLIKKYFEAPRSNQTIQEVTSLFVLDRKKHTFLLTPLLLQNISIMSVRYDLSTYAYQFPENQDQWDWLYKKHQYTNIENIINYSKPLDSYTLIPHITFYINISPDIAISRINKRAHKNKLFEYKEKLEIIANAYKKLIFFLKKKDNRTIIEIDGTKAIEDSVQNIIEKIKTT